VEAGALEEEEMSGRFDRIARDLASASTADAVLRNLRCGGLGMPRCGENPRAAIERKNIVGDESHRFPFIRSDRNFYERLTENDWKMQETPVVPRRGTASRTTAGKVPDSAALRRDDRVGYSADTLMPLGALREIIGPAVVGKMRE
jgi:hypothetical protein